MGKNKKEKHGQVKIDALHAAQPPSLTAAELSALYTPDEYRFTLSHELKKVASAELKEDVERDAAVVLDQLRCWIRKADYVTDCRIDANFLLRFLRVKKFNTGPAFDMLVNYIVMRQKTPAWFHGLSLADPCISDLIDRGVLFVLPERDLLGRRIIFSVGGNIDPAVHTFDAVMRTVVFVLESLLEDEENQIRGFAHILDESGLRMAHVRLWRPADIAKVIRTCEKSMPVRHRKLDFVAMPPLLNFMFEIATSMLLTPKLRNRFTVHRTQPALQDGANTSGAAPHLDRKMLPAEYGGITPMADMIAAFKAELAQAGGGRTLARVAALDRMSVDVERMKKSHYNSMNLLLDDLDAAQQHFLSHYDT